MSARLRGAICIFGATIAVFACSTVAVAEAATYHYCNSCFIRSYTLFEASQAKYITQDYVHRLAGPAGVTIGAVAQYADNYAWGSYVYSTSTEVIHGYTGNRPAWGAAANFGGGNYSFNAHVTY
ncbi:MAG: hypothetical protein JHC98_03115 [Thermoleophilaceae bacterium]|nr:hypothetical protein [Thermoleophilaceae bacterium]